MCRVDEVIDGRIFDTSVEMKDNAMLKVRKDLFWEWDFVKNDELGLDVYKVTKGSEKVVWWKCNVCGSSYDMMINIRLYNAKCSYCSNRKVNHTNSLASQRPDLAKQWHPTLNGEFTPDNVTYRTGNSMWWICELGHVWEARVTDRNKYDTSCCVICLNKKVLKGYNDCATTHPELAELLLNKEDGYRYTYGSKVKVDWQCFTCGATVKDKSFYIVNKHGISCPNCSSCMKFPERVMHHLLKEVGIEFSRQEIFSWSDNRRYDFYIPSVNCLIETHGEQHYNGGFSSYGGRTLKEEEENDKNKYEAAISNGINNYVVIDCRKSDFEYIKNNIINSELSNILDLSCVDWDNVNLNSQDAFNIDFLKLWNDGLSLKEIVKETKTGSRTISKILMNYDKLGKCEYDSFRGRDKNRAAKEERLIHQFDTDFNLIKVWKGFSSIKNELGYSKHSIRECCFGRSITSHGFIWKLEKDLDKELAYKLNS